MRTKISKWRERLRAARGFMSRMAGKSCKPSEGKIPAASHTAEVGWCTLEGDRDFTERCLNVPTTSGRSQSVVANSTFTPQKSSPILSLKSIQTLLRNGKTTFRRGLVRTHSGDTNGKCLNCVLDPSRASKPIDEDGDAFLSLLPNSELVRQTLDAIRAERYHQLTVRDCGDKIEATWRETRDLLQVSDHHTEEVEKLEQCQDSQNEERISHLREKIDREKDRILQLEEEREVYIKDIANAQESAYPYLIPVVQSLEQILVANDLMPREENDDIAPPQQRRRKSLESYCSVPSEWIIHSPIDTYVSKEITATSPEAIAALEIPDSEHGDDVASDNSSTRRHHKQDLLQAGRIARYDFIQAHNDFHGRYNDFDQEDARRIRLLRDEVSMEKRRADQSETSKATKFLVEIETDTRFDLRRFLVTQKLTRDLVDVEARYDAQKNACLNAGIQPPGSDVSSGFIDDLEDGYMTRFENALIASCRQSRIELWLSKLPDCNDDCTPAWQNGDADCDEWDGCPMQLWDSLSIIALHGSSSRKHIDRWRKICGFPPLKVEDVEHLDHREFPAAAMIS
ncbi:hypothetical protein K431DRAFT_296246 [Polychaeton citri CBS 116435]|uniref:Uncharacterized protein n=1 Tax=Polychaeton citri CBS 116435 TaxID=1314669 RepID=A0A9P4Q272_9PEZI|nr:hypothetical protein K431DRAFT_296246 [Polychaeton citri CBS 116435]